MLSPASNARCSEPSLDAVLPHSAVISNAVTAAPMSMWLSIHAVIATAQSASRRSRSLAAEAGVESAARALQPCRLHPAPATGCTRTQKPASYLRSAVSCCLRDPDGRSPPIDTASLLASAFSPYSILGISDWNILPTCTAWFLPAAWHPTHHTGSLVGIATSFRRRGSAACSVAKCWPS
jgi:hypothetical protein